MSRLRPVFAPRTPVDAEPLTIYFDGDPLPARPGDTVSAALLRAGHLATTRSPKYRRPRGPYCLIGECGTCQLRIAGQPNLRACLTVVQEGLVVESQNAWGPAGLDPTRLVDHLFRRGFDHHHFLVRPRLANVAMQAIARTMTGFGVLPELPRPGAPPPELHEHVPTVLVLGAGPAGRALTGALEAAGVDVLALDRRDRLGLGRWHPAPLPQRLLVDTGAFGVYAPERLIAAASPPLAGGSPRLHLIRPRHIVFATGAREGMIPLLNNDLPGVLAARGLAHLLERTDSQLTAPCVLLGDSAEAEALAAQLGVPRYAPADVERILGRDHVEGLVVAGRTIPCRVILLAPTRAPISELAAQAGAQLRFDGAGFAVLTAPDGRALLAPRPPDADDDPAAPPWQIWACGHVRNTSVDPTADGLAVAAALLAELAASEPS